MRWLRLLVMLGCIAAVHWGSDPAQIIGAYGIGLLIGRRIWKWQWQ